MHCSANSARLGVQQLKVEGWMKIMEAYELVDDDFTLHQAVLCYVWSRMTVIDEVKDFAKFEALTFIDFMEALALVADFKWLPLASDLAAADINMLQWSLAKASGALPSFSLQARRHRCAHQKRVCTPAVARRAGNVNGRKTQRAPSEACAAAARKPAAEVQVTPARRRPCQSCSRIPSRRASWAPSRGRSPPSSSSSSTSSAAASASTPPSPAAPNGAPSGACARSRSRTTTWATSGAALSGVRVAALSVLAPTSDVRRSRCAALALVVARVLCAQAFKRPLDLSAGAVLCVESSSDRGVLGATRQAHAMEAVWDGFRCTWAWRCCCAIGETTIYSKNWICLLTAARVFPQPGHDILVTRSKFSTSFQQVTSAGALAATPEHCTCRSQVLSDLQTQKLPSAHYYVLIGNPNKRSALRALACVRPRPLSHVGLHRRLATSSVHLKTTFHGM